MDGENFMDPTLLKWDDLGGFTTPIFLETPTSIHQQQEEQEFVLPKWLFYTYHQ